MRFATVGDNTIDEYVGAEELSFVGGNAVNVAVRLAELGRDVAYFGAVGPDARGRAVREALVARGVSVAHLLEIPGTTSTSQVTVAPNGERHLSGEHATLVHIASARRARPGRDIVHNSRLIAPQRLRGYHDAHRAAVDVSGNQRFTRRMADGSQSKRWIEDDTG